MIQEVARELPALIGAVVGVLLFANSNMPFLPRERLCGGNPHPFPAHEWVSKADEPSWGSATLYSRSYGSA